MGWRMLGGTWATAWVLLVELISHQFASSVHWIKTQDLFFEQYKCEHFIEVGPAPMLAGMAVHTLKAKYETKDDSAGRVHRIFCTSKDQKDIYYQFEDEPEAAPEQDSPAKAANPAPAQVAAAPAVNATPPATAGPATSIKGVPIHAVDILAVIVSQKLKKQLSEIPLSKSITGALRWQINTSKWGHGQPSGWVFICPWQGQGASTGGAWRCLWIWSFVQSWQIFN